VVETVGVKYAQHLTVIHVFVLVVLRETIVKHVYVMLKQIVIMQELAAFLITIVILNATAHVQIYTQDPHAELLTIRVRLTLV